MGQIWDFLRSVFSSFWLSQNILMKFPDLFYLLPIFGSKSMIRATGKAYVVTSTFMYDRNTRWLKIGWKWCSILENEIRYFFCRAFLDDNANYSPLLFALCCVHLMKFIISTAQRLFLELVVCYQWIYNI